MSGIYADLTPGGEGIVLVAGGQVDDETARWAAKHLKTLTPLFSKSDPPGALTVPATWQVCVQLAATFGDFWRPQPRLASWISEEAARRTKPITDEPFLVPVPDGLVARPYQIEGALEIARTGRALIFDEPRTGKTITTILGLAQRYYRNAQSELPILVVCPASVVDPWVDAFNLWAPYWTAVAWRGSKRHTLVGTADVYVTSYDTARVDSKSSPLLDLEARTLVVDESHYIKNHQAQRTKAVRRLARNAESFVALSGTPITHHPGDLFPTLDCLAPGAFPSRERWVQRYCLTVPGDYDVEILGLQPATEPEFRLSILGQHRRVARADVMADLPPKVYSTRTVELPAVWRNAYNDMARTMLAELPSGEELTVMSVLAQLTRLGQLASAPADVEVTTELAEDGTEKEHVKVTLRAPSWKVGALLEILDERPGESVVCFAPSAQLIRIAGAAATEAGYRVGYVIGGQSQADRTETIRAFQAGELDLICATTGAGGVGITLSRAGTLVFLQRPWSLVESLQAEDRAEGDPTAPRGTEVIDVIAKNTIDTRIRSVLRERAGQLSDLVQDPRIITELLGGSASPTTERKAS